MADSIGAAGVDLAARASNGDNYSAAQQSHGLLQALNACPHRVASSPTDPLPNGSTINYQRPPLGRSVSTHAAAPRMATNLVANLDSDNAAGLTSSHTADRTIHDDDGPDYRANSPYLPRTSLPMQPDGGNGAPHPAHLPKDKGLSADTGGRETRPWRIGLGYRCSRCGMPKKGHVCMANAPTSKPGWYIVSMDANGTTYLPYLSGAVPMLVVPTSMSPPGVVPSGGMLPGMRASGAVRPAVLPPTPGLPGMLLSGAALPGAMPGSTVMPNPIPEVMMPPGSILPAAVLPGGISSHAMLRNHLLPSTIIPPRVVEYSLAPYNPAAYGLEPFAWGSSCTGSFGMQHPGCGDPGAMHHGTVLHTPARQPLGMAPLHSQISTQVPREGAPWPGSLPPTGLLSTNAQTFPPDVDVYYGAPPPAPRSQSSRAVEQEPTPRQSVGPTRHSSHSSMVAEQLYRGDSSFAHEANGLASGMSTSTATVSGDHAFFVGQQETEAGSALPMDGHVAAAAAGGQMPATRHVQGLFADHVYMTTLTDDEQLALAMGNRVAVAGGAQQIAMGSAQLRAAVTMANHDMSKDVDDVAVQQEQHYPAWRHKMHEQPIRAQEKEQQQGQPGISPEDERMKTQAVHEEAVHDSAGNAHLHLLQQDGAASLVKLFNFTMPKGAHGETHEHLRHGDGERSSLVDNARASEAAVLTSSGTHREIPAMIGAGANGMETYVQPPRDQQLLKRQLHGSAEPRSTVEMSGILKRSKHHEDYEVARTRGDPPQSSLAARSHLQHAPERADRRNSTTGPPSKNPFARNTRCDFRSAKVKGAAHIADLQDAEDVQSVEDERSVAYATKTGQVKQIDELESEDNFVKSGNMESERVMTDDEESGDAGI